MLPELQISETIREMLEQDKSDESGLTIVFESSRFPFRITLCRISQLDFTASGRKGREKNSKLISTLKRISNRKTTKAERGRNLSGVSESGRIPHSTTA
ncbi:hypothetical protein TNCT_177081 [Trichonephila clavata]|uniref:Uncharacterized protein n=1 Tax=Trichonephila clavata TaxID=2740835 RepID=A0A8X6G9U9_TRICU|nr:hypothetical protein TNCT_177081 [Trichonephila clavata]